MCIYGFYVASIKFGTQKENVWPNISHTPVGIFNKKIRRCKRELRDIQARGVFLFQVACSGDVSDP